MIIDGVTRFSADRYGSAHSAPVGLGLILLCVLTVVVVLVIAASTRKR